MVKGVRHFRPYLYGRPFKLRSDHASLRWLCLRKEPSDQVARWLGLLAEFPCTLEHRAGIRHGNADGLSRRACVDCQQCDRIEKRDGGPSHQEFNTMPSEAALEAAGTKWPVLPDPRAIAEREEDEQESCRDCDVPPTVDAVTRSGSGPTELAREQAAGNSPVAVIYQALESLMELTGEQLSLRSAELRKLERLTGSMRIRPDGVLEVRVSPRWCAICPLPQDRRSSGKCTCLPTPG